jgi:hypothetical protein
MHQLKAAKAAKSYKSAPIEEQIASPKPNFLALADVSPWNRPLSPVK